MKYEDFFQKFYSDHHKKIKESYHINKKNRRKNHIILLLLGLFSVAIFLFGGYAYYFYVLN